MDDRNGECSDHHEEMYGSINTSDSEHECLKDFLLEPGDSSRNVPCSTINVIGGSENILNNCMDMKSSPHNNYRVENVFTNCSELVNSSKIRPGETGVSHNCIDVFNASDLDVNADEINARVGMILAPNDEDIEQNGDIPSYDLDSVGLDLLNDNSIIDDGITKSDVGERSDSISPVHRNISNDDKSTKFEDKVMEVNQNAAAVDSECNSQDTLDYASDEKDKEVGNGHSSVGQSASKGRTNVSRERKRKGADTSTIRGRAVGTKKRNPPVTYQSQISPDQNGIKLRIKKSPGASVQKPTKRRERVRKRKPRKGSGGEDEITGKKERWKEETCGSEDDEMGEQSGWGLHLPEHILHTIFSYVTRDEGCLPFLVSMSKVCRLWRKISLIPSLWHNIDLTGPWVRDRYKGDAQLRWLCENRLTQVQELNAGGWKLSQMQNVLDTLCSSCQNLCGLTMTGWIGLSAEHLKFLVANCPLLSRLDLSSTSPEGNNARSAVSMLSVSHTCQTLGERLTHLVLANNRLTGLPQIVTAMATHCPNLEVLDISNMRTHNVILLHIEKLQAGCQKLRVLRITNSQISLSPVPLKEQAASPGFPALEELSVAGISGLEGLSSTPIMDDNSVERILKKSHKLRLLDVRGSSRISDSSLVRVPAWDLEHLFLSGCYVTRMSGSGLELIVQKWSHSLVEMDLAWSTATEPLDCAVSALAERGAESPLRILNLCGSSVSLEPVKAVVMQCPQLMSLNLSSCRALPRGMKRLYEGYEVVAELRSSFEEKPEEPEAKEPASDEAQEVRGASGMGSPEGDEQAQATAASETGEQPEDGD